MIAWARRKFFNEEYTKLLTAENSDSQQEGDNELRSLTILADGSICNLTELEKAVYYFREAGIKTYGYLCLSKEEENPSSKIEILNKKDASWYGVPHQNVLIKWLAKKTDVLIVVNQGEDLFIKYLIAASNSRLKASLDSGLKRRNSNIDFYVKVNDSHKFDLQKDSKLIFEMLNTVSSTNQVVK